jgi:hypothetical protein
MPHSIPDPAPTPRRRRRHPTPQEISDLLREDGSRAELYPPALVETDVFGDLLAVANPSPSNPYPHRPGTWGQTVQRAQARNATIEPANPQLLQIDLDGPEAYERFNELIEMWENIPELPRLGRVTVRPSRTPGNKHVTIALPHRYRVITRILMQALLGSDLRREMLAYASHRNHHPQPIVLFRPQEAPDASTA